ISLERGVTVVVAAQQILEQAGADNRQLARTAARAAQADDEPVVVQAHDPLGNHELLAARDADIKTLVDHEETIGRSGRRAVCEPPATGRIAPSPKTDNARQRRL